MYVVACIDEKWLHKEDRGPAAVVLSLPSTFVESFAISGSSVASTATSSSTTTTSSGGDLSSGVILTSAGVASSGPGVSGVSGSSTSVNSTTTAATTVSGVASGGFMFFNVAESGAVLTSGIGTVPSVASVATAPPTIAVSANVTQVWPTIPAVFPPRLYTNKYVPERNMNDWLREMQLLRNELLHYKKIISDEEFAEILLRNVAQTHREVVRQFSKHYDPGFQRNTPSSAQVMNALRAESELDERSDKPSGGQDISSVQSVKGSRANRGGSAGNQGGKKNNGEDPRECWNCHKTGHIQTNCPSPRRKDDGKDSALPERQRFLNKKTSGKSDGNARHVDMLLHQDSNSEIVATQSAINNSVEWILDSASDCHVCTNKALLSNLRQDDGPLVFNWEGKPSRSRGHVGDLELRVRNENQPDTTALLQLSTVIYTATGTSNLLSLDKLEKDGWEFIKLRQQSWAWLRKGSVLLKLMKTRVVIDYNPQQLRLFTWKLPHKQDLVTNEHWLGCMRDLAILIMELCNKWDTKLKTGDIKELKTVEFAEDWTVDRSYVEKLLLNRYLRGKYRLPAKIPYVRLDKLTSPGPTTTLGSQTDDEHRNKRHCSQDLRTHIVVDAPPAMGASVLPSVPISGALSMNPTRTAETDARSSRARGLREDSVHSSNQLALSDFDEDDMDQSWSDANDEATDAVTANGDPVEGIPRSVGVGKERDDEEDIELGASFRRSTRIRRPNVRLSDYNVDIPASLVIQSVNELLEPTSVPEALSAPDALKWIEALDTEYQEKIRNYVWDLVDLPPGEKVLKNKWVFVKKRNAKGEIVRYRARITVKGCQQEFGVNFWETYAPVSKIESVRPILLLALYLGLNCRQVDFVTAFFNGPIGEADIYMEQPDYFDDGSGHVCKLRQSLYGLRQAPRIWYQVLDKYLRKCGFNRTKMDAGVYVRAAGANKVFITVYVDDLLIVGADPDIEEVVAELKKKFKIKDLGNVKNLLRMEITYVRGHMLTIAQKGYCEKVLKRFKMDKCKPVPTPQVKGNLPRPGDPEVEPVCVNADTVLDYRQIVGLCKHHVLAKRVLRYLRGTTDYGLVWTVSDKVPDFQVAAYVDASKRSLKEVKVEAYADADLGNEKTTAVLSLNLYYNLTGFVAAAECSTMVMWTHNLFEELGLRRSKTTLYDDNQAAIAVIKANTGDFKVKGVDLKYHKVRDYFERGEFDLEYCPSEDDVADIFTKPLGPTQFKKLRQRLNVIPVPDINTDMKTGQN
ncbi:unnamed protein product [Phytophthora fragariaefolia]|uniref:Unnamed protein product n=1 Tax=Phytophthora fragariaefolia TaxID=1490495 RepID=A0A9W7CT52_9STRA|nr:unnamed protein product [Phytophthora fragariaefolia]